MSEIFRLKLFRHFLPDVIGNTAPSLLTVQYIDNMQCYLSLQALDGWEIFPKNIVRRNILDLFSRKKSLLVFKIYFSHRHQIAIYQKNQFNLQLFHLSNQIHQIIHRIKIRQVQIRKIAKK